MSNANRLSMRDIKTMPIGDIAALPADQLALLQEEAEAGLQAAKQAKEWIDGVIALRYGDRATAARAAQGKDTGTVRFDDGPVTVIADFPKRVEWNQAQLAPLVERIRASGEDPSDYVDVSFKVPERKFTAWPAHIRSAFMPARTVHAGKPSFALQLRDNA